MSQNLWKNHLGGLREPGAGSWQGENPSVGPRDPYFPQRLSPLGAPGGWGHASPQRRPPRLSRDAAAGRSCHSHSLSPPL